jgi:DNA-binding response OmpR family regulator
MPVNLPRSGRSRSSWSRRKSKTGNVIAAKEAGVNNYIVKPFNAQTLQNKVQSVFPDDAPPPRAA